MMKFKIIVYSYMNKSFLFTVVIYNQKMLSWHILEQCVLNEGLDVTFLAILIKGVYSLLKYEKEIL